MANKNKKKQAQTSATSGDINAWVESRFPLLLGLCLVLATTVSLLLFDFKIGVGGDDSAYIKRAFDLANDGAFPSFQGPLYPMVLSVFVLIFGIQIPLFKLMSLLFMLAGLALLLITFRGRVRGVVLLAAGLLFATNSSLLFFASQTYVEALFFFLLSLSLYTYLRFFEHEPDAFITKNNWNAFLLTTLTFLLLMLSKSIGFAFVVGGVLFLVVERKWKRIVSFSGIFIVLYGAWYATKNFFWNTNSIQFSDQATTLFLKNPYAPSEGKEEALGFVQRFFDNIGIYLSKHFLAFFDLREITSEPILILGLVIFVALIFSVIAVRKNKALLLVAFTMFAMLLVSFVVLQKIWDTPRLVIPFMPFLTVIVFSALYEVGSNKTKLITRIIPFVFGILLLSSASKTISDIKKEKTTISDYLSGKKLKGYSPDWVNFIKMSDWAAKNTPDTLMIASRKPSISFLHTGRKFFGIYRIPMHEEEAYFADLKKRNVRFIVLDEMAFAKLKLPMDLLLVWKQYLSAFYAGSLGSSDKAESKFYGVYVLADTQAEQLSELLKEKGVAFEDASLLLSGLEKHKATMMVIKPDELLQQLKDRNSRYLIMASLRKYEGQKTPYTINTMRRYIFYMQHKYPGIIRQVGEVGNDEKAFLFEVLFERGDERYSLSQ